jgi:hypothetical protein
MKLSGGGFHVVWACLTRGVSRVSLTRFSEPPRAEPQELRAFGALRVRRCGVPSVPHGAYATHPAGQRDRPERRYRNGDTRNENHLGYVEHLGPVTRIGARRLLTVRGPNAPETSHRVLDSTMIVTALRFAVNSPPRPRVCIRVDDDGGTAHAPCSRPSDRASQRWPD